MNIYQKYISQLKLDDLEPIQPEGRLVQRYIVLHLPQITRARYEDGYDRRNTTATTGMFQNSNVSLRKGHVVYDTLQKAIYIVTMVTSSWRGGYRNGSYTNLGSDNYTLVELKGVTVLNGKISRKPETKQAINYYSSPNI